MIERPQTLVIPAAGLGTRMRRVNPDLPKELLPVASKPAIQYAVAEGANAGIYRIVIVINPQKNIVRQYFEDDIFRKKLYPAADDELQDFMKLLELYFLYQEKPGGEADAIQVAREKVGDAPFAVIYPDNIFLPVPGALKTLLSVFLEYGKYTSGLMEVRDEDVPGISNSGKVDIRKITDNTYKILKLYPKGTGVFTPRFSGELRTCGISISTSDLFEYIERARVAVSDAELTDGPVREIMLKEKEMMGCRLPGRVFDIGNPVGYAQCLQFFKNH